MPTQQLPAYSLITECKLCCFGHLLCCSLDHPTLGIYHFDPSEAGWRRPRGTLCTHWSDVVRCDFEQLGPDFDGTEEITRAIEDDSQFSNLSALCLWQEIDDNDEDDDDDDDDDDDTSIPDTHN